jgi:hypothetical protein
VSGRRGKNAKAALTLAGLVKTRKDAAGLFGQAWRIFETLLPDIDKAGWPGARTRLVPRIAPLLFRLALVRRFLFRAVSQIGVNYRNSPLSMGAAGAVRSGDRLPWVETEPGKDNFAPLASLTWQVHVYGEPRRGVAEVCVDLQLPLHLFTWQPAMQRAGLRRAAFSLVRPDGGSP